MRIVVIVSVTGVLAFAQGNYPAILTPANCSMPLLVEGKPLTIELKELAWAKRVNDNGFREILDGGSAETDVILNPKGLAGRGSGTSISDSFFVYAPSGAKSALLNERLSENLSQWKWKAAACSGALLKTLPRNAWIPNNGFEPNGQYMVATLLHIRYTFQKEGDQQYAVKVAGISFTPECKEIILMMFEFRGANGTIEYPGPTLACKEGKRSGAGSAISGGLYEYIPPKKP